MFARSCSASLIAALALAACSSANQHRTALVPIAVPAGAQWETQATEAFRGKRDDIHFANASTGFYGTGKGDLFRTDDGGASWAKVWSKPGTFIRAIGFIDADNGFIGNVGDYYPGVTDKVPLYRTSDGGRSWSAVDIGGTVLEGICAIDVLKTEAIYQGNLRERVIVHAAGRVGGPAKLLRSVDGGESWAIIDLSNRAGMILDVKFLDADTGFIFAGTDRENANSNALILKTRDGGRSWREVYRSSRPRELIWKASFADGRTGYATVQSYDPARAQQLVVKTTDGGETWREVPLVEDAKARQFGIGFATPDLGWVGTAAGGFETRDGGKSWAKVPIAPAANQIRVRAGDGTPMIVAIGTQVQKLPTQP